MTNEGANPETHNKNVQPLLASGLKGASDMRSVREWDTAGLLEGVNRGEAVSEIRGEAVHPASGVVEDHRRAGITFGAGAKERIDIEVTNI